MEAEERPKKLRKLSHDHAGASEDCLENEQVPDGSTEGANIKSQENVNDHESQHDEAHVTPERTGEDGVPAPEDVAPSVAAVGSGTADPPLSKNQLKKLKKKAEWESKREERKVVRKEKQNAKRERKKIRKQQEEEADPEAFAAKQKQQQVQRPVTLPITFLIDCDFDDLMRDNERISLAAQITRCYSDNKKSRFRAHLTICSFGGKLRERFDNVLTHYQNWQDLRTFDGDFVETGEKAKEWMSGTQGGKLAGIFSMYSDLDEAAQAKLKEEGEIVYLTADAEETLLELKPHSTYIIGGLVDKNREKGICYKRATKRNIKTAKLPIGEYMDMTSRKVLAVNHVNEIMVKWLECGDWAEAFLQVIPKRKGGQLKKSNDQADEDGEQVNGGSDSEERQEEAEEQAVGLSLKDGAKKQP